MRPNWRSSGVATAEAMVSGLAPGRLAPTLMVGKSICGSGATGKNWNATIPDNAMARVMSEVATGRRMKGAEKLDDMFTANPLWLPQAHRAVESGRLRQPGCPG